MAMWNGSRTLRAGLLLLAALVPAMAGCRGTNGSRSLFASEPPLIDPYGGGSGALVAEAPARQVTFVDRHPLLSKPAYYYESSGDNPLVKATAATVIGIPAGIVGEMRQIVVGQPAEVRAY